MSRPRVKMRMAEAEDGERVGGLVEECGFTFEGFEIDWSDLGHNWVVAEIDGEIVGTIQISPSLPFGRLENLAVDPELGMKARTITVRDLISYGLSLMRASGCQAALGVIPHELEGYRAVAVNRGWREVAEGDVMMKRLA